MDFRGCFTGKLSGKVTVSSDDEERGTKQGVGARGVHRDRLSTAFNDEIDLGTGGSADPVALHAQDFVRPLTFELGHVIKQAVGIVGDAEIPLRELLFGYRCVAALAQTAHDLLIGQDGLAIGAPVDIGWLAIGQSTFKHLQEQPLVPVVVLRVTGIEDAIPVKRTGIATHRCLLGGNVFVGPRCWIRTALDSRVFRRKTKRIPANRVQDVKTFEKPIARGDITHGVCLRVTHVQVTRWVRKHVEHVLLWTRVAGLSCLKWSTLVPHGEPLFLHGKNVVTFSAFCAQLTHACVNIPIVVAASCT